MIMRTRRDKTRRPLHARCRSVNGRTSSRGRVSHLRRNNYECFTPLCNDRIIMERQSMTRKNVSGRPFIRNSKEMFLQRPLRCNRVGKRTSLNRRTRGISSRTTVTNANNLTTRSRCGYSRDPCGSARRFLINSQFFRVSYDRCRNSSERHNYGSKNICK